MLILSYEDCGRRMSFNHAYGITNNDEQIARLTGMFRDLAPHDREKFLADNGLTYASTAVGQLDNGSQSLQISPARHGAAALGSPRMKSRTNAALRLVQDDNTILEKVPGKPLMNVSGVRFTDEEIREWFNSLDSDNNGYLSKDEFRAVYNQLELFGTPVRQKWLEEQLAKMKAFDDGRLSYDEFAYLVTHVALR